MPHPRTSWLRRLRRLCLFLLLGLMTTVGVAWGSALWFRPAFGGLLSEQIPPYRMLHELKCPGGTQIEVWGVNGARGAAAYGSVWGRSVPRSVRLAHDGYEHTGSDTVRGPAVIESRGFPLRALRSYVVADITAQDDISADGTFAVQDWKVLRTVGALAITDESPSDQGAALPYLPYWPGLLANTLFYTLLWWLAFASLRMVKHNRRYRRGLCPLCRYDLLADYSNGCSECGWKR
ncbi:MAG: hypothetical protein ACF8LK_00390 [Phycisphaerales bacterium JB041]